MAFITGPPRKRRVKVVLEELRILRCVRSVTTHAIHHRRLNAEMCRSERRALRVMALATEQLQGLHDQGRLPRKMGLVAPQAIARRRRMGLLLLQLRLDFLMTGKTDIRTRRQQQFVDF